MILKFGSSGSDVKKLQSALGIKSDGIFGSKTQAAVRAYQQKNGLKVDGLAGDLTLGKLYAKPTTPATVPIVPAATSTPAPVAPWQAPAQPTWSPPGIPDIPDYTSHFQSQIDQALNNINNQASFSYDPNTDPAFQAYMGTYEAKGQTAFNDQLGSMAAASGGRVSSWAGSAASQAQNSYIQQGMSAAPQFMNAAYQRYRDTIGDNQNKLETLLALDDKDFQRYESGINNDYQKYTAQMDQYTKAIEFKSSQFSDAMERTKINGYVSNEDALVIGVKPGTPSQDAQKAAQDKQIWLEQQAVQLKNEKELLNIKFEQEKKLIGYRAGSSGSGSSSFKTSEADFNKYKGKVDSFMNEYEDFAYGDKVSAMTPQELKAKELQYVKRFDTTLKSLAENKYITDDALAEIWNQIQLTPFYKDVYLKYRGQEEDSGGYRDAGASN